MNSLVLASLSLPNLVSRLPGGVAQGIIWGIMALGVYITFRLLDVADLTVDGSFTTGGAVTVMLIIAGWPAWAALLAAVVAGLLAGLVTGLLHTKLGIPAILAGILTQFALYSINLRIMSMKANTPVNPDKYSLFLTLRSVPGAIWKGLLLAAVLIALLYWYFGTEQGSAIRARHQVPALLDALRAGRPRDRTVPALRRRRRRAEGGVNHRSQNPDPKARNRYVVCHRSHPDPHR